MAEVRQCFGRGTHGFARKIYNRYLPESPNKHGESAIHASSLSAGFLLDDIENGGLYRAQNTAGLSPDSYARLKPLLGSAEDVWKPGSVLDNYYYYPRCEEYSLSRKTQVQINERSVDLYRRYDELLRTFSSSTRRQQRRRFFGDYGQFVFIRAYSGNGTRSEPLYKTKTGYYETLEVAPTATQAQIKTAYYKQSFVYHPDRNAGSEEATVRFSEINEAYTVLGNKGLRKKYDRGLLSLADLITTARPSGKDSAGSSAQSHAGDGRSVGGADSQEGVFAFERFFKSHYGEQLQREQDVRNRKEETLKKKHESIGDKKLNRLVDVGGITLVLVAMALIMSLKRA